MSRPSELSTAQAIAKSHGSVEAPDGWPPNYFLPLAVAQLAIMGATNEGRTPENIETRLAIMEVEGRELDGQFYAEILTEEERRYLPSAEAVVGLIGAAIRASQPRGRGLIN